MYVEMFMYEHIPYLFSDSLECGGISAAVSIFNVQLLAYVCSISVKRIRTPYIRGHLQVRAGKVHISQGNTLALEHKEALRTSLVAQWLRLCIPNAWDRIGNLESCMLCSTAPKSKQSKKNDAVAFCCCTDRQPQTNGLNNTSLL